jgi:hypothetical protein
MHEPLVVAPERLVVPRISNCRLPYELVDEVHVFTPQLSLHTVTPQVLPKPWLHLCTNDCDHMWKKRRA